MADFLQGQMDYLLFFYGLSLILLVATCQLLKRRSRPPLPWKWLAAFSATHGVHEWLVLLAQGPLPYPFLDMLSLILATLSFVFLAEFGRASLEALRGHGPGRWILWSNRVFDNLRHASDLRGGLFLVDGRHRFP